MIDPDNNKAAERCRIAAEQGDALAQFQLALFYQDGRCGLVKNEQEAAQLYKLAADQGHAGAQAKLGYFLARGRGGLKKDEVEAARLYRLAADQGETSAQIALGFFYENGRGGLPQDDQAAARLYKLAADQGNPVGQTKLADFYEESRGGLPNDVREAARLYKFAADQGDTIAATKLSLLLGRKDARLFERPPDPEEPNAMVELGFRYEKGHDGTPRDDHEVARLYKMAAAQENVDAMVSLGVFCEEGRGGFSQDDHEAARLYQLAANEGHAAGQFLLARLYEQGRGGLPKDPIEAARLYHLAGQTDEIRKYKFGDLELPLGATLAELALPDFLAYQPRKVTRWDSPVEFGKGCEPMELYPRVPPIYWLAVARAGEAIDLLFSGQARTMGWSKFFETYPVTMHPDFPAAIEACAEITSVPGQPQDRQWSGMADWLRRAQDTSRQNVPQGYVAALFNLGIDLKGEKAGERRANLQEAANSFQRAAEVYAALNNTAMLERSRAEIAAVSATLANL